MTPHTYAELAAAKRPVTKRVRLVLDPDVAGALERAEEALDRARADREARPDDVESAEAFETAQREVEAAREVADSSVAEFVFRAVGQSRYDELLAAHPPTPAHQAQQRRHVPEAPPLEWNPDTFPPALVAACLVEPALTEEQVADLWASEDWNQAEARRPVPRRRRGQPDGPDRPEVGAACEPSPSI